MPTTTGLAALLTRVKVLLGSALTKLSALLAVLVAIAQQIDKFGGVPAYVPRILASVIAVVTVAVFQVRRVTPVNDADKGLLPPKGPAVPAPPLDVQPPDKGAITVSTLLLALALACFIIFTLIAHGTIVSDEGFTWLGGGLSLWVASTFTP